MIQDALFEHFSETKHLDCPLRTLEQLVSINSSHSNPAGIFQIQSFLADQLVPLGFKAYFHPSTTQSHLHMLELFRPGTSSKTVTLVAHADTVLDNQSNFFLHEKTQMVTGPGVADDKAGLVVALNGLKNFLEMSKDSNLNLRLLVSPNEEKGSIGFLDLYRQIGERSDFVLGMEPGLENGAFITSRNGNRWYKIKITGQAFHSGRVKKPELNPGFYVSQLINELSTINEFDPHVSCSVSSINGGKDIYNLSLSELELKLDFRFPSFEWRQKIHTFLEKTIDSLKERFPAIIIYYCVEDDCPPMSEFTNNQLENRIKSLFPATKLIFQHATGAADVNYLSTMANMSIDGFGAVGGKLHTKNEYIVLKSLYERIQILTNLFRTLNNDKNFLGEEIFELV